MTLHMKYLTSGKLKALAPDITLPFLLTALLLLPAESSGQNNMNKEVNVVRPYSPSISDAFKLKFIPTLDDTVQARVKFDYFIQPVQLNPAFRLRELGAASLRPESSPKLKNSWVKLGFGNYWTPYAEVDIHTTQNTRSSLGVQLRHLSSQGRVMMDDGRKVYAGYADNEVRMHGSRFFKGSTLSAEAYFTEDHHFLYGYNTDTLTDGSIVTPWASRVKEKDSLDLQRFIIVGSHFRLRSNERSRNGFEYQLKGGYDFLLDDMKELEHNGVLDFSLSKVFNKFSVGGELGAEYVYRPYTPDTLNYAVAHLDPWVGFTWKYVSLMAGPKVAMDRNGGQFHFYPRMKMEINITNLLVPYLGLDGYYENHTYRSISRENPYIADMPLILPTNHRFVAYGGLRGRFTPKVAFNLAVSWKDVQGMHFFVADTSALFDNKFLLLYDDGEVLTMGGEVSLRQSDQLSFILKGNYYQYKLDNIQAPWHKPGWDLNFTARYSWRNKLAFRSDLFVLGDYSVPEIDPALGGVRQLDGLIDLNIGMEYRIKPFISLWLQGNNLLSDHYFIWQNYPMHRINFVGGVTFIF